MTTTGTYEYLSPAGSPAPDVSRVVNDMRNGGLNVTGRLTMADATTETVVVTERAVVLLIPLSEAAADVKWWNAGRTRGTVTIGHDAADGDLDFAWVGLG